MTVTAAQLATFVGLDLDALDTADREAEEARVSSALAAAIIDLDIVLAKAFRPVPPATRTRLELEVGHAYYKRQDSPSGNSQSVDFSSGLPVAGPRDPLAQVMPIIRRFILPF